MLSRVADSLYWMSRYMERAETTARLLEINMQLLLDVDGIDEGSLDEHWKPILSSFGHLDSYVVLHGKFDHNSILYHLTFETKNLLSIYTCIQNARENARMVRDQISAEMWETLNEAYHLIKKNSQHGPDSEVDPSIFAVLKEKSLLFQGVTEASYAHDQGYKFIQIGKYLERADQTSRLVDIQQQYVRHASQETNDPSQLLQWITVLRTCSAFEAYHHQYLDQVTPVHLAEFLLLSASFPRSVRYCISALDYHMRGITFTREGQYSNLAEQLSGRLRAEIGYTTTDEILAKGLHDYIDHLQRRLIELNDALLGCYVHQPKLDLPAFSIQQQQQQQ